MARNGFAAQFIQAFGPASDRAISQMRHQDRMELKRQAARLQRRNVLSMIEAREARTDIQESAEARAQDTFEFEKTLRDERTDQEQAAAREATAAARLAEEELGLFQETRDEQVSTAELQNQAARLQVRQLRRRVEQGTSFTLDENTAQALGVPDLAGTTVPREFGATLLNVASQRGALNAERGSVRNLPSPQVSVVPQTETGEPPIREATGLLGRLMGQGGSQGRSIDPVTGQPEDLSIGNLIGGAFGRAREGLADAFREPLSAGEQQTMQQTLQNTDQFIQRFESVPMRPEVRSEQARTIGQQLEAQKRVLRQRGASEELVREIEQRQQQLTRYVGNDMMRRIQRMSLQGLMQGLQEGDTEQVTSNTQVLNAIKP